MGFTVSPMRPQPVLCSQAGENLQDPSAFGKTPRAFPKPPPSLAALSHHQQPQHPPWAWEHAPGDQTTRSPRAGFTAHPQLRWSRWRWDSMGGSAALCFSFFLFFLSFFFFSPFHINCSSDLACQEVNQSHAELRGRAWGSCGCAGSRGAGERAGEQGSGQGNRQRSGQGSRGAGRGTGRGTGEQAGEQGSGQAEAEPTASSPPRNSSGAEVGSWLDFGPCMTSSKALGVPCHWSPLQCLLPPPKRVVFALLKEEIYFYSPSPSKNFGFQHLPLPVTPVWASPLVPSPLSPRAQGGSMEHLSRAVGPVPGYPRCGSSHVPCSPRGGYVLCPPARPKKPGFPPHVPPELWEAGCLSEWGCPIPPHLGLVPHP